jgi:hypothetical protein
VPEPVMKSVRIAQNSLLRPRIRRRGGTITSRDARRQALDACKQRRFDRGCEAGCCMLHVEPPRKLGNAAY